MGDVGRDLSEWGMQRNRYVEKNIDKSGPGFSSSVSCFGGLMRAGTPSSTVMHYGLFKWVGVRPKLQISLFVVNARVTRGMSPWDCGATSPDPALALDPSSALDPDPNPISEPRLERQQAVAHNDWSDTDEDGPAF